MGIMIPGAINIPAQTFYPTLSALMPLLSRYATAQSSLLESVVLSIYIQADGLSYKKVIFHCSSSNGRGPRCAGWYQDELDRRGEKGSAAYVLKGGIKAWMAEYRDEVIRI